MPLSDTKVRALKPREKKYIESDEKGLAIEVTPTGAKRWVFRFRLHGKRPEMAIGLYPDVSLKRARELRDEARQLVAEGVDPRDIKRARKESALEANHNSFAAVSDEWFTAKMAHLSSSSKDRATLALERDLKPYLGKRPISEISPPEVLRCLRRIESRGTLETAHRVKRVASQVFRFAVATGRADRDPTTDLSGALTPTKKKHLAAITDPTEVGRLLTAMEEYQGTPVVRAALKLSPLLFCRPGELRKLEWAEINWEARRIELPSEKMKMGQPHIIPLAEQPLALLRELEPLTGRGKYVFPSARGQSRPLSDNGVRTALRSLGYDNETMTAHGFRAMARTLLDEVLGFRVDYIEHQLAHEVKDTLGRAYNRTKHLEQRAAMMQKWADYLDSLKVSEKVGNVIAANFNNR
ncbi:integrase arm-type DNA-binding domain-containing protein [Microbulbifer sp. OS29]|uniref:Integrase arm-type DNA-binding domain-containing protein n=1 Tax=Microbulbifer okhotskensis TaxID=2926617 RepID=A0A9X2J320_9GAMM|nr:integrase arm-type DNA-binding domain-containing protein [Microbulbifer okhotskensis]MCO1333087.1 integrase arm-type DNA-binding domain-containing protein [Microbulbifer okhotskensis]